MSVSIEFDRIVKVFDRQRAVDDVSLRIEPGELFFLLGPSGCGKTTLLRCLAGFCRPDSGVVRIAGRDVTALPPERRDTGMVFQSYALWPHLTVRQNVAFGLEQRAVKPAEIARRVEEALQMVRMRDRAEARPAQLSGGQQQRVALARALVIRPTCLLLDEPLSNLDAGLRLEMRGEIRRICKQAGLTAIYVTHDQKEALSIADRLAIMEQGALRQVGRPQEVYLRPASRFVAGFIGETNFLAGVVEAAGADGATVATAAGRLVSTAAPPAPLAAGDRVTVSLRPEVIHLGEPPPGVPNVLAGAVHDTVYLGEMAQHQVSVAAAAGREAANLKVFELNPKIVTRDAEQAPATLWIRPANVVVLKE